MISNYAHLIGGLSAGFVSTVVCHPFELLRVRYSANDNNSFRPQYKNYFHAVSTIYKANGIRRGLYQGMASHIVAATLSRGIYFYSFHGMRPKLDIFSTEFANNLYVGTLAGTVVVVATNPFWVVRTRLCLQYENEGVRKYSGMINCWRQILKTEGWKAMYKGLTPSLLGTVNDGIQFAIYNYLKDWKCRKLNLPLDSHLDNTDYMLFSTISKIAGTVMTFPYMVVRTRQQDHHTNYTGVVDVIRKTYKYEGIPGFYKGLIINVTKLVPHGVITFMVYEHVRRIFDSSKPEQKSEKIE